MPRIKKQDKVYIKDYNSLKDLSKYKYKDHLRFIDSSKEIFDFKICEEKTIIIQNIKLSSTKKTISLSEIDNIEIPNEWIQNMDLFLVPISKIKGIELYDRYFDKGYLELIISTGVYDNNLGMLIYVTDDIYYEIKNTVNKFIMEVVNLI